MELPIAGAGGHGRVIADTAADSGIWSEIAFLDHRLPDAVEPNEWPVVGRLKTCKSYPPNMTRVLRDLVIKIETSDT